ncbi:MAG: hypothetical protein AAGF12_03720 [Myxococcota bacterium]
MTKRSSGYDRTRRLVVLGVMWTAACGGDDTSPADAGVQSDAGDAARDATPDGDPPIRTDGSVPTACGEAVAPPADPTAGAWNPNHYLAGIAGPVTAIVEAAPGEVVIGGEFTLAGTVAANNVVRWTGSAFEAIGNGIPTGVRDLAIDGAGDLWALGNPSFDPFTGGNSSPLFRFDTTMGDWVQIASAQESAEALAVDTNGQLLVAGAFTQIGDAMVANLARYDGATFVEVAPGTPGGIEAILPGADELCVGGLFDEAGGVSSPSVACFREGAWVARGLPVSNYMVSALARDGDGALIAGGHFDFDDSGTGSVARWTGDAWEIIGGGLRQPVGPGYVETITWVNGQLFVAGRFIRAGETVTEDVAVWDGTTWNGLAGGLPKTTFGVGLENVNVHDSVATDGSIYFTGQFSRAGNVGALGVARWDGAQWRPLREPNPDFIGGTNGSVFAIASFGGCGLYVGGSFTAAGDSALSNVALLDPGAGWTALGEGLPDTVSTLLVAERRGPDDDRGVRDTFGGSSDAIVFAGMGSDIGEDLGHLAAWNGSSWARVGEGFATDLDNGAAVSALAVDDAGNLWAGGLFGETTTGTAVRNIAIYDGTSWAPVGEGLDGAVRAIAIASDGTVYAGGEMTGGVVMWDGTAWSLVGGGLEAGGSVSDLALRDNVLYIAGFFDALADGTSAPNLVVYDGTTLSELSPLPGVLASDLEWVGDTLIVAGLFDNLGDGFESHILLSWNGTEYAEFPGQPGDLVEDIESFAGALYVGGLFTTVGDEISLGVGSYDYSATP